MKIERRFFTAPELRAAAEGEKPTISGYAAVFNQETELGGYFAMREKIAPGAFARALKEKQDVRALLNHDPNLVLGRTKAKTLTLREDDHGLFYEIEPPDTQTGRDVTESIRRGDISQSSFAFIVRKQEWIEEKGKDPLRIIKDVDLFDVSPVTYPAYDGTDVAVRAAAMFPQGEPEDLKQYFESLRGVPLDVYRRKQQLMESA